MLELGALGVVQENVLRKRANGINVSEIEFTCEKRIFREVQSLLQSKSNVFPGCETIIDNAIARVSLVGYGVHSSSQFRSDFINLLKLAEIPVCMLTASALTISAVLPSRFKNEAVTLLHKQFCIQQYEDKSQRKSNPACTDEVERQLVFSTIAALSACAQEGLSILGEIDADSCADETTNTMEALTILN